MTKEKKTSTIRKPYSKPQLERVQLIAEEAVLLACKTGNRVGPGVHNCNPGSSDCHNQGPS